MNTIRTRTAIAAVFLQLSSAPLLAQDNEPITIVVTPSGIAQPVTQANTTLTVIDEKMIKESNARSVAELLRGQAGINIRDLFGDGGSQATVDLRGFGPTASSNTLVLVDGRRLNNSTDTAAPDLSLIDVDDIAQIEILQGSGGVLYGNQAVGGVVNIIRKKSNEDSARVDVNTGSYNSKRVKASGTKALGRNRISGSASDSSSDNYRDHNESRNQRLALRAERIDNGLTSYIETEAVDEEIDTPGALLEDELDDNRKQSFGIFENDFFDTETRMIRVGFDKVLDDSRSFGVDYARRETEREFIQSFRGFTYTDPDSQDRDNKVISANYRVQPVNPGILRSYVFGITRDTTDYEIDSIVGLQTADQEIDDIFLSTQWAAGANGQIDVGVRRSDQKADITNMDAFTDDEFDVDDTVTVFSLGYSHVFDQIRLFVRADENFRYPTVEEHTLVGFGEELGLDTQQGVSYEFGLEYRMARNRLRGTLYRIDLEDEIVFDNIAFANLNLDETRRNGFILEGSRQFTDAVNAGISYTLLDSEITEGEFDGNDLPLVPERVIRVDGSYRFNPELLVGLELIAVDEQVFGGDFDNELDKLDSYEVVNAQVFYERENWTLGFRVNNLLDEEYSETGSLFTDFSVFPFANEPAFFPSPERNFWLSFSASI